MRTKWTLESATAEALKYLTRVEFQRGSGGAYNFALKNGFLDSVCKHMIRLKNIWTLDECIKAANSCESLVEFYKNFGGAVRNVKKNDWFSLMPNHVQLKTKPNNFWTKENCHKEALKYTNHTEFRKNSGSACNAIYINGWNEELTSHFEVLCNKNKRFIYAYEFPDNHVYVGLTYNISKRKRGHSEHGSVFNYIKETGLTPKFKQLIEEPVEIEEARKLENFYVNKYKYDGWSIINKAKTGSLGGNTIKWDYNSCLLEALKYKFRTEFCRANGSAYAAALRNKWLDEICSHMITIKKASKVIDKKPPNYWSIEQCIIIANECKSLSEIKQKYAGAYYAIRKNNWQNIIIKHFTINEL